MNNKLWYHKLLNLFVAFTLAFSGVMTLTPAEPVAAAGELTLTIIAAPNLVVDSNALSPSTYAPKVATVIAQVCNTTATAIDNVTAYIGDYTSGNPGIYPSKTNPTVAAGTAYELTYRGTYAFEHLGGTADATRFIGSIPANTCVYQYWSFEYPHYAINDDGGATITTWGVSVKPDDDLSLDFDMWVTGGGYSDNASHTMTMRNEISAMANKIKPNGNPGGQWFNTDTSTIYPGQTVTTNGILYRLGNVNQGFDNDGDGVPDYNAWLQPFGDPAYDPSCFRLIGVTGVLTVTRSGGNPDMIIPIDNNLYFTNLPPDNTNVVGLVYYEFLALGGACTIPITPYQEVASGSDNEKFNGDYGTGVPSLMSYEPEVKLDKNGNVTVAEPGTITYAMPFQNDSDKADAGLTLTSGGIYAPLMIQDMVPEGLQYVCGSADVINREPDTLGYEILFSKDSGATWGSESATWPGTGAGTCETAGNYVIPAGGERIVIRFILTEPLPKKTGVTPPGATATFNAYVPGTYISGGGDPFIENCAEASFGGGVPFAEACTTTMVRGNNSIGDVIWSDENGDGFQNSGELGLDDVTVRLYWDKNGNKTIDEGEPQLNAVTLTVIDGELYQGGSLYTGPFDAYEIVNGRIYGGGNLMTGLSLINGYNVINGYLDINGDGSITAADDGAVTGATTQSQSATITAGVVSVTSGPTDAFAGYTLIGGLIDVNGDGVIDASDTGTGLIGSYNTSTGAFVLYDVANGYVRSGGVNVTSANLIGTYGFAYLPNANYIVEVVAADYDITTGYTPTTPRQYVVSLTGSTNNRTSDFGFGPTLDVIKTVLGNQSAVVGETVSFEIKLTNKLPGSGTAAGGCVYYVWPGATTGNAQYYVPLDGALGVPDRVYAVADLTTGQTPRMEVQTFSSRNRTSNITKVEAVALLYLATPLIDDSMNFQMGGGASAWTSVDFDLGTLNTVASGESALGYLSSEIPGANAPGNSWNWADFDTALTLRLQHVKTGGPEKVGAALNLDALGFRVTTDDTSCINADTTIAVLPLEDTYNTTYLEFLSADPPPTSHDAGTGTLYWENLGPLYAGGETNVTVNFKALATIAAPGTTNEASVTGAKFGNGRSVNDADDDVQVPIGVAGSIGGVIWADTNSNGWQGTSPTGNGYDGGDTFIPGVKVNLLMCLDASGVPTGISANTTCAAEGGSWVIVQSAYTDNNGAYLFEGLRDGFYNVKVDESTLPPLFNTRSAEPNRAVTGGTGSGVTCPDANCDGMWYTDGYRMDRWNNIVNGASGENILKVSFGYQSNNTANGAVVGNVWHDVDSNGTWETNDELPLSGITVRLCADAACTTVVDTTTTTESGRYAFGNVPPGNYYVVVTPPNGMDQTGDPDVVGACSGAQCDHQTTVTVVANAVANAGDFGYVGGYSIGDTIYTDWNGDGDQDAREVGIGGVTMRLYRDWDGDGETDPEDKLLATYDTFYNIIAGGLDINNDGVIDENDDKSLFNGYRIIDGKIDLNGDGVIDDTDDGTFMGYTVINGLIDFNNDGDIDGDDTADLLGFYEFTDIPGNGANYLVRVNPATLPAGYVQTADPDSEKDNKTVVTLTNADVDDADFGYQPRGQGMIGDTVWLDDNGNGVQNTGESGQPNVTVNLYHDANGDGIIDPDTDALVATTTTLGYTVVDGYIYDGASPLNGVTLYGYDIINGAIDINGDGLITASDDGDFGPYRVVDGRLDMDGDGAATVADDGDLYGFYLFQDLPAGDYIVEVAPGEFTAGGDLVGLTMTNTGAAYDGEQISRSVALSSGQEFFDADFGFTASSIGDFIWEDSNGDGLWENGEAGIAGVVVELYLDANNDGVADGAAIATATTDSNGLYLFGGLAPNNYLVKVQGDPVLGTGNFASGGALEGYSLTGDPDAWNNADPNDPTEDPLTLSCLYDYMESCDGVNRIEGINVENADSTFTFFTGLQLGQNDMSSDFGYQPPALIGDFIWQDLDGDGVQDSGEPGIAGVTVNLYADADNDGVADGGIIATAVTNDEGYYYFTGQPASHYIVEVAASNFNAGQPLEGYTQTGDPDATLDNTGRAHTTDSGTPVSDLSMDFGYQGSAVISGTLFFDKGPLGGIYQSGTDFPFSGVQVYLYDSSGTLVGSTFTNGSGYYEFNVPPGTYEVRVADSLSTQIKGMTWTYEPDLPNTTDYCGPTPNSCNNRAMVNTSDADVLTQDFGIFARVDMGDLPNSYNKTLMGEEGPMHIGPASGNPTIFLGTLWDSELDGHPALDAGMSGTTGDDGNDSNDEDGVGFLNPWTQGGVAQLRFTITNNDTDNYNPYLIGWFDWDNSGDLYGPGEMAISQEIVCRPANSPCTVDINVPIPSNAYVGMINMRFRLYATQSPPPFIAPTGTVINGEVEDYQRNNQPTAVTLVDFAAAPQGDAIRVTWETASELDNLGFNLYRSQASNGPWVKINGSLIPPQFPGSVMGGEYEWLDTDVAPGVVYYYRLEDVETTGIRTFHGPVSAHLGSLKPTYTIFLPFVARQP